MSDANNSRDALDARTEEGWHDHAFDLTRGLAVYQQSRLVAGLSRVIGRHPQADVGNAFNAKQVACKIWARDSLFATLGGRFGSIWLVGGWYGVLAGMLLEDPRFDIDLIESTDIDGDVEAVALTLNRDFGARFAARTADMYTLDYRGAAPDLVINTSCEHIGDLRAWLSLMAPGTRVLIQSNDYFSEPTHVACVESLAAFRDLARLSHVDFAGELPQKKYTRFMLIGRV